MLTEKNETYYKAFERRDPKFDGRVYFGVKTTGIYCRPICPARPARKNVSFYSTQAAAEAAGYRPCKRCRPDLSPLSPQWQGSAAVIGRALEAIKKAEVPLSEVAERMGMTDRHLRRLFSEHVGASPVQIRQSYRLHLAQQLLAQTSMKMIDVAMAAGFGSVRRFNDAFAKTYKRAPAEIRKEKQTQVQDSKAGIRVEIPVVGSFDFQSVLHFFKRHLIEGVEFVGDDFYERHFEYGAGSTGWFRVSFNEKRSCIQLQIDSTDTAHVRFVIERVKALFDLQHNPAHIQVKSARHRRIAIELQKIRIPGAFSTYETAVCIILGQLVSTERARQLVKSLVSTYGPKLKNKRNESLQFLFPLPQVLATAPLEELGLTGQRAQAIRDFSAAVRDKQIDLDVPLDLQIIREKLIQIKGIGPWTVEMMAMRCLSDADAFPAKDLIIQRELQKLNLDTNEFANWKAYLTLSIWQKSSGYPRVGYSRVGYTVKGKK